MADQVRHDAGSEDDTFASSLTAHPSKGRRPDLTPTYKRLHNLSAAEDHVALVKDGTLAGCHGKERFVKDGNRFIRIDDSHFAGDRTLAVTHHAFGTESFTDGSRSAMPFAVHHFYAVKADCRLVAGH